MKTLHYILPLSLLLAAGCSNEETGGYAEPEEILLAVDGIAPKADANAGTRAAVDKWDNTTVAYAFGNTPFAGQAMMITLADDNDKNIKTGLVYPSDDTPVSFIGCHPAKTPNDQGFVSYNLSTGDQDVMLSNKVSGKLNDRIVDVMKFEHRLTRFTFVMECTSGSTYPETVHGIKATATNQDKKLMISLQINLNNGQMNYSVPGSVTNTIPEGAVVPQYSATEKLSLDLMLQPDVPVNFEVITLTDVKQITFNNSELNTLLANGGAEGMQYTVKLWFKGEAILAGDISVRPWDNTTDIPANETTWW